MSKIRNEGFKAWVAQVDISIPDQVRSFFGLEESFDSVVNSSAMETSSANVDDVMAVNCRGNFLVSREAARGLSEFGGYPNIESDGSHEWRKIIRLLCVQTRH